MWPSRKELIQLMGMDDAQWKDASYLQDLLSTLQEQRECDIDAKDVKGRRTGYFYAARSMFRFTFRTTTGPFYDVRRKSLWYLGWKGPKYYILQKSHHLYLYANPKAQPSKCIAKFDMLKPEQRQALVEIRRLTAEKYPPTHTSLPPKHKDVMKVQRLHNSRRERQIAKKLAQGKSDALRE